ncbi:UDP-4-amino-4,6-dideoxy-N-acetyl-beta-L-altrosamine N-acetyltransferase [Nostoc sp.]|uniref:UDP-4-amino-4, 6-dideoxy-N-acetyl-beta-L-altrosamine N-acetyltransferase n=1 Tax=Nostoc sp. TaxID=1180 RepID=UPI002FFA16CF
MLIALRDILQEDKETIRQWRNLPEVAQYMYSDHYITPEEHENWFQQSFHDTTRKHFIITYAKKDVGTVDFYNIDYKNKYCYWAFYLASTDIRGKGIGGFVEELALKYVFEKLQLNKLCCEVFQFNQSVIDLHKSFGFTQEGYFRQHIFKAGRFFDVVSMAILREEWDIKHPQIEQRLQKILGRVRRNIENRDITQID